MSGDVMQPNVVVDSQVEVEQRHPEALVVALKPTEPKFSPLTVTLPRPENAKFGPAKEVTGESKV